jgi:hypothetical protein
VSLLVLSALRCDGLRWDLKCLMSGLDSVFTGSGLDLLRQYKGKKSIPCVYRHERITSAHACISERFLRIQASRDPDFRYARNALWDYYKGKVGPEYRKSGTLDACIQESFSVKRNASNLRVNQKKKHVGQRYRINEDIMKELALSFKNWL